MGIMSSPRSSDAMYFAGQDYNPLAILLLRQSVRPVWWCAMDVCGFTVKLLPRNEDQDHHVKLLSKKLLCSNVYLLINLYSSSGAHNAPPALYHTTCDSLISP